LHAMAIRLSELKSLCTPSELALVRASRKPELAKLEPAQLQRHARRARKLFDKWQDLSRQQARSRSRQAGFPDLNTRTQLKVRVFQEALQSLEAEGARRQSAGSAAGGKPAAIKPKRIRTQEHRKTRARVRAQLTTHQLGAAAAAKQSRVSRSGLTTRVRGHVSARGKRAQARRDGQGS
jgi:hypothetical protein